MLAQAMWRPFLSAETNEKQTAGSGSAGYSKNLTFPQQKGAFREVARVEFNFVLQVIIDYLVDQIDRHPPFRFRRLFRGSFAVDFLQVRRHKHNQLARRAVVFVSKG